MNEIVSIKNAPIPTKTEVENQVNTLVEQIKNGWTDPLQAYGMLTALEKVIEETKKAVKPLAIEAAKRYAEKGPFEAHNAEFMVKNLPSKYDFTDIPAWRKANLRLEKAKKNLKDVEDKIIMEVRELGCVRPSNGETLQVTLKK
jgi:hypothetical protein